MDAVGKCLGNFSIEPLKEPKGFIKAIQWILAIFAFATTTSVSTYLQVTATACPPNQTAVLEKVAIGYPFDIENAFFTAPFCNRSSPTTIYLLKGSKSSAEFYVFFGVMVFLYCMAALIVYLFFEELYRRSNLWAIVDFVISAVITLLWLISSAAWAQGLVDLKYFTDFKECGLFGRIPECKTVNCVQVDFPKFGSLNASVLLSKSSETLPLWIHKSMDKYIWVPEHGCLGWQPLVPVQGNSMVQRQI
ncbi:synaptophysin-like isoform X2 [Ostrea edulis]|uniref:synaptophysin-like isoform X2 n=1 Tax=Ostrea edulis TaxID=37623 RepID=UPI0024AEE772|nr:synaptophysin-like isoform X2 [Ostrea edulis]